MAVKRGAAADPDQLWLDLGDTPERGRSQTSDGDSVFFAIQPDPSAVACVAEFARGRQGPDRLPGKLRPAHVLHVSLIGLGKYETLPREVIAAACHAASTLRAAPFVVALDRLRNFGNPGRPAVVLGSDDGVVGVTNLYAALRAAMGAAGFKLGGRADFTPHMTLLYGSRTIVEDILEQPVAWTVRELVLVRSRNGQTRHELLGRWPLRG